MTSKAIGFFHPRDAGVLEWLETPEPKPRPRDLIVR